MTTKEKKKKKREIHFKERFQARMRIADREDACSQMSIEVAWKPK